MNKHFKKFVLKITVITTIIVVGFNASLWLLSAFSSNKDDTKNIEKTNENTFRSNENPILWKTWAALNVNLGTKYTQRNELPADIYLDAITLWQLMQNWSLSSLDGGLISRNMVIIGEYKNVLRSDFKWKLNQSHDREAMLNSIISQLTYRYNLWVEQVRALSNQKTSLVSEMTQAESSINSLKTKISSDFTKNDSKASYENIENYLDLRNKSDYARVYIVYINQFLSDYTILSNYTKSLIDTLSNNRDAIIKNSYVVIPDSGVEFLREFDLLYNGTAPSNSN